jgi:hypothetical protein
VSEQDGGPVPTPFATGVRSAAVSGPLGRLAGTAGALLPPGTRSSCQQLPGPEPAVPLLHRPDRRIQRPDHAQPVTQPGDRRQPRVRRQRPIWHADSHPTASRCPRRILFTR